MVRGLVPEEGARDIRDWLDLAFLCYLLRQLTKAELNLNTLSPLLNIDSFLYIIRVF